MEPIVSPWLIYLASISGLFKTLLCFFGMFGFGVCAIYCLVECIDENSILTNIKKLKKPMIICIILSIIGLLIPNEKTIYTMIIAKNVTYNNINFGIDTIKELIDYIVTKIGELK